MSENYTDFEQLLLSNENKIENSIQNDNDNNNNSSDQNNNEQSQSPKSTVRRWFSRRGSSENLLNFGPAVLQVDESARMEAVKRLEEDLAPQLKTPIVKDTSLNDTNQTTTNKNNNVSNLNGSQTSSNSNHSLQSRPTKGLNFLKKQYKPKNLLYLILIMKGVDVMVLIFQVYFLKRKQNMKK